MATDHAFSAVGAMLERIRKNLPSEQELADYEAGREADRRRALWESRRCPPVLRDTDEARVPAGPWNAVRDWRMGDGGLLLHGPTRSGKTRALSLLVKRLILGEGRSVLAWRADDLAEEFRTRLADRGINGITVFRDALAHAHVLWIDDLGKGRFRDDESTALWGLVDDRLAAGRPIWITTEHVGATLAAQFCARGDRPEKAQSAASLVARLREACRDIPCGGNS